jgi:hypothetical protein
VRQVLVNLKRTATRLAHAAITGTGVGFLALLVVGMPGLLKALFDVSLYLAVPIGFVTWLVALYAASHHAPEQIAPEQIAKESFRRRGPDFYVIDGEQLRWLPTLSPLPLYGWANSSDVPELTEEEAARLKSGPAWSGTAAPRGRR